ncbi:hypothetical protein CK203_080564 [Vitis vinifera]|uniref:Uncharacterized protein n=1 Tax=Vitis vinifera TaxID=29760 RepID=A0A438D9N6_VITVI|nr:hypothetical protein CK203_080564 [Vitis vinifera]
MSSATNRSNGWNSSEMLVMDCIDPEGGGDFGTEAWFQRMLLVLMKNRTDTVHVLGRTMGRDVDSFTVLVHFTLFYKCLIEESLASSMLTKLSNLPTSLPAIALLSMAVGPFFPHHL